MPRTKAAFNPFELAFRLVVAGAQWHGDTVSTKWAQILYLPEGPLRQQVVRDELARWDANCYKTAGQQICIPYEPLIGP